MWHTIGIASKFFFWNQFNFDGSRHGPQQREHLALSDRAPAFRIASSESTTTECEVENVLLCPAFASEPSIDATSNKKIRKFNLV